MVSYGVIGLGQLGHAVAVALAKRGAEVVAVDLDMERVEAIKERVTRALCLDATDDRALKASGMGEADTVILALGEEHLEQAVLTTMILREFGVGTIVSRAATTLQGKVLERVGVTEVVYPEREMGILLARKILNPSVRELVPLSKGTSLAEVAIRPEMVGISLAEANLRQEYGLNVVALRRPIDSVADDQTPARRWDVDSTPGPDTLMRSGDILVVVGTDDAIREWT